MLEIQEASQPARMETEAREVSMLTRRDALVGAMTAGAVLRTRTSLSKASQPETPVNFEVPENACDCHTHIHGDPQQFPFFSGRIYTPELASPEEMSALHRMLHVKRVVIVTPSVYGTQFRNTLRHESARRRCSRGGRDRRQND